jgi:hypothetical protein
MIPQKKYTFNFELINSTALQLYLHLPYPYCNIAILRVSHKIEM